MTTILLADDNKHIREYCKRELENEGYRVLLARDGREAAQIVQSEPLDLAILDWNMPLVGGREAAEQIKAAAPHLPVLFFSACDAERVRAEHGNRDSAWIEKSEDLAELKHAVTRLLAGGPTNAPLPLQLPRG